MAAGLNSALVCEPGVCLYFLCGSRRAGGAITRLFVPRFAGGHLREALGGGRFASFLLCGALKEVCVSVALCLVTSLFSFPVFFSSLFLCLAVFHVYSALKLYASLSLYVSLCLIVLFLLCLTFLCLSLSLAVFTVYSTLKSSESVSLSLALSHCFPRACCAEEFCATVFLFLCVFFPSCVLR